MPGEDAASSSSKSSSANRSTPLLVSPSLAIIVEPATPTTPHDTPPATPINTTLLSPPSLKRRSQSKSNPSPTAPPPRPSSAPPRLTSFNTPRSSAAPDSFRSTWYFSRNSLIARRTGRTVTVPPPPLGQSLVVSHSPFSHSTHLSPTHHFLAKSEQIRGVGSLLFAFISPHPPVCVYCCRS